MELDYLTRSFITKERALVLQPAEELALIWEPLCVLGPRGKRWCECPDNSAVRSKLLDCVFLLICQTEDTVI